MSGDAVKSRRGAAAVREAFARAAAENRAAFVAYLTAGYPDRETFLTHARLLLESADVLEVGLPYSDPLGDGPTIQRSSQRALESGVTPAATLEMVSELREHTDKPVLVMTYYNPVYTFPGGETAFVRALAAAGADGMILPDLPPDEAAELRAVAREQDVATVFLVAPTSTEERLRKVTAACSGFIYAVSVTGVTGARAAVGDEVPDLVERTRALSDLPVAVGFGVSGADTARPVARIADGVIVGSALIAAQDEGRNLGSLAREIAGACRR